MLEIGCRVAAASIDSSDKLRITCSRHQISQVKKKVEEASIVAFIM
jgi:hypothetical protein